MKCIEMLANGDEVAKRILTTQVLEWGIGGLFFFNRGPDIYPNYFRGEAITKIAKLFSEIDGPEEGKNLREFMRFLMWKQRNLELMREMRLYFNENGMGGMWTEFGPKFGLEFPEPSDIGNNVEVGQAARLDSFINTGMAVQDRQIKATVTCQNCGDKYDPEHGYSHTHCTQKCFREAVRALDTSEMFKL